MVGMGMGVEHGIDPGHLLTEHLTAQIRRRIDEQGVPAPPEQSAAAGAPVARIRGTAHLAVAPQHGHTGAGTGAEQREMQGLPAHAFRFLPGIAHFMVIVSQHSIFIEGQATASTGPA
jgi:hypothetical protein